MTHASVIMPVPAPMHDVPAPIRCMMSQRRRSIPDPRAAAHALRVSGIRAPPRMHSTCQRSRAAPRGSARASRVSQLNAAQLPPPLGTLAPRPRLSRPSWWGPPTPGEMVARGVRPHPPTSPPKPPHYPPPPDTLRVPPRQTNATLVDAELAMVMDGWRAP